MSKLYNEHVYLWEDTLAAALVLQWSFGSQIKRQLNYFTEELITGKRMIKKVLIGILCGAAVLTAGILIGHFGITKRSSSAPSWVQDVAKDVDESLIEKFLSEVDNIQIQENLRWADKWSNEISVDHSVIHVTI